MAMIAVVAVLLLSGFCFRHVCPCLICLYASVGWVCTCGLPTCQSIERYKDAARPDRSTAGPAFVCLTNLSLSAVERERDGGKKIGRESQWQRERKKKERASLYHVLKRLRSFVSWRHVVARQARCCPWGMNRPAGLWKRHWCRSRQDFLRRQRRQPCQPRQVT